MPLRNRNIGKPPWPARLYLAVYDITEPRRLNRIARYPSKRAVRVQYSVPER